MTKLQDLFSYDPTTGIITYKISKPRSKMKAGDVAEYLRPDGYLVVNVRRKQIFLHRLAWYLTHGVWVDLIDHRNQVRNDNRLTNLRDASHSLNVHNKKTSARSGIKGVRIVPSGKFVASIKYKGINKYLGSFDTIQEASDAYSKASKGLFP